MSKIEELMQQYCPDGVEYVISEEMETYHRVALLGETVLQQGVAVEGAVLWCPYGETLVGIQQLCIGDGCGVVVVIYVCCLQDTEEITQFAVGLDEFQQGLIGRHALFVEVVVPGVGT